MLINFLKEDGAGVTVRGEAEDDGLAGLGVFLNELAGEGALLFLGGVGIVELIRPDGEDDLVAILLVELVDVVHQLGTPLVEAAVDVALDAILGVSAGVQRGDAALGVDVVGDLLHVGHEELVGDLLGEEGSLLGAPVVMDVDEVERRIVLAKHVDDLAGHVGRALEEVLDRVGLILVDQREGGGHEVHEGDQALKPEAVDQGDLSGVALVDLVFLGLLSPFPGLDIGNLDDVSPVVDVVEQGVTGVDDGAAGGGHELPLQAENVHRVLAQAAAETQAVKLGVEVAVFARHGDPEGLFLVIQRAEVLARGDRRVVHLELGEACIGLVNFNDFQLALNKGNLSEHRVTSFLRYTADSIAILAGKVKPHLHIFCQINKTRIGDVRKRPRRA